MNETLFFILGIGLVVAALVLAAAGLRWERFPASKAALAGITGLFCVLVVATMSFGWLNAEDEQEHREAELAEAAEENIAEGDEGEAAQEIGPEVAEETTHADETASVDGAAVFEDNGCGSCHTLADAGTTATTGPPLDGSLEGKDTAYIEESIVDPNKVVVDGYPPDVMPQSFGDSLSPEELKALVSYLSEATGGTG